MEIDIELVTVTPRLERRRIRDRARAKIKNKKYYDSNKEREAERCRQYHVQNTENIIERKREYRKEHPEKISEYSATYRETHREIIRDAAKIRNSTSEWKEYSTQWRIKNAEKERIRLAEYAKNNKDKLAIKNANRRAAKLQATPTWADTKIIERMYIVSSYLTEATLIPHEMDHIIPLKGKDVCGLHVHNNLRIVRRTTNRSKGNRILDLDVL